MLFFVSTPWEVRFKRKLAKSIRKLPLSVQAKLQTLVQEIRLVGPVRGNWPNYSKLSDGSHHCHLSYRYVAVWVEIGKQIKLVEVTYVGNREKAPY